MDRVEEIKDRAKCHDDTDPEDRDWLITEIDQLRRKTAEMWAGIINRDTEITDNRQEIDRLKTELKLIQEVIPIKMDISPEIMIENKALREEITQLNEQLRNNAAMTLRGRS